MLQVGTALFFAAEYFYLPGNVNVVGLGHRESSHAQENEPCHRATNGTGDSNAFSQESDRDCQGNRSRERFRARAATKRIIHITPALSIQRRNYRWVRKILALQPDCPASGNLVRLPWALRQVYTKYRPTARCQSELRNHPSLQSPISPTCGQTLCKVYNVDARRSSLDLDGQSKMGCRRRCSLRQSTCPSTITSRAFTVLPPVFGAWLNRVVFGLYHLRGYWRG